MRTAFTSPKVRYSVEERLKDMDQQKVDVQVLSIHTPLIGYHLEAAQGLALAREVNDEIGATVRQSAGRLAGLATLPVQDVKSAIGELERAVSKLGLKGASLDTQVNGEQWDEPKFLPFFKAAEQMGAVLFYHPQPQNNFLMQRINRHGLFNSLGVILDDAIVTAVLICGGVLEKCPDLKVCIAHGGGPACSLQPYPCRPGSRRHRMSSSAARFFHRIFSFSSGVSDLRFCTHATGEGCHPTNGQSLPSTTRSAPTRSRRKRSASSLGTTVS